MSCSEPRLTGTGGSFGMQSQPDIRLLRFGNDRFQEILRPFQLLGSGMRPLPFQRRQALRNLVIIRRVTGATPSDFLLVAFRETVGVKVVLDHRQTQPCPPRGSTG